MKRATYQVTQTVIYVAPKPIATVTSTSGSYVAVTPIWNRVVA